MGNKLKRTLLFIAFMMLLHSVPVARAEPEPSPAEAISAFQLADNRLVVELVMGAG